MFLRNLIIDPFYAIGTVIVLWGIFHFSFNYLFKLKEKRWAQIEYVWIIIGFMGVLSFIIENKSRLAERDINFTERWIERDIKNLIVFSKNPINCFKYNKGEWLSDEQFAKLQEESELICNWTKEMVAVLEKALSNRNVIIENYPKIDLTVRASDYPIKRITGDIELINENILKVNNLKKELNIRDWKEITYSYGVLLLLIAFAIRLSLVSRKLKKLKEK